MRITVLLGLLLFLVTCQKDPDPVNPEACFTWWPDSKNYLGDTVYFSNCSNNADRFIWFFGDDSTSSQTDPIHVFNREGKFWVSLVAFNNESSDTVVSQIEITQRPAPTYLRMIHNKELVSVGRGGVFTMDLDVDGDGIQDYQFKIDSWSQLSGTGYSKGSIAGIHGTFGINGYTIADTTFLNKTWSKMDGAYWGVKVAIIRTDTETCRRISENDSLLSITTIERMTAFRQEEIISPGELWTTQELHFWNSKGYGPGLWEERRNADTAWFMTRGTTISNCNNFPSDTSYIGIRYFKGNLIKTGWISVLVRGGKIQVFDSGIME